VRQLLAALAVAAAILPSGGAVAVHAAAQAGAGGGDATGWTAASAVRALVDEELVDDVIDTSALSDPERAARFPDPLHAHVDVYWAERFAEAGRPYRSPAGVVGFATTIETGCGLADPNHETAFYCVLDETIYYSVEFRQIIEANIGDYGWVVVVAHEWAHHAQRLLGYDVAMLPYQAADVAPIALEQQADCLAGAYTEAAELSGWLHPGDVDEAITMTGLSGDPPGTTAHHPTAHGSGEERVAAFVRGYEQGIVGCDLGL
jgi:predicted metalloprotease